MFDKDWRKLKTCVECGATFMPTRFNQMRCSKCIKQLNQQRAERGTRHCRICGRWSTRLNQDKLCSFCKKPKPHKPLTPKYYCKQCKHRILKPTTEKYNGYCKACYSLIFLGKTGSW